MSKHLFTMETLLACARIRGGIPALQAMEDYCEAMEQVHRLAPVSEEDVTAIQRRIIAMANPTTLDEEAL